MGKGVQFHSDSHDLSMPGFVCCYCYSNRDRKSSDNYDLKTERIVPFEHADTPGKVHAIRQQCLNKLIKTLFAQYV